MDTVRLGRTDLRVGEIGVGCWAVGGPFFNLGLAGGWDRTPDTDPEEGFIQALRSGANLFDTADVYGFGTSERVLGHTLQRCIGEGWTRRENIIIASKVGYFSGCAEHPYLPLHMRHQLEMSLCNLCTDYLDIYWFHHLDFGEDDRYLEQAISQMQRFKAEGRVRFIGLRGPHKFSPKRQLMTTADALAHFLRVAEMVEPDLITLRYNALSQKYDGTGVDLFEWARDRDIGVITYKTLGQGLLLDKYDPQRPPIFSAADHRSRKNWFQTRGLLALHRRLEMVNREFGCATKSDLAHLFIKYALSRAADVCVLVGFRNADQIRECASVKGRLTAEQCRRIREIFEGISQEIGDFIATERETR